MEGLRHPAAQMSFTWIENNAELRRVIEGGDFGAWRVFLHPEQRKYAERSYSGPFRLSGGAGTGKTVVLLHRTRMLARREPDSRILLTTFTDQPGRSAAHGSRSPRSGAAQGCRPRRAWYLRVRDRRGGERGPAPGRSGCRRRRGGGPWRGYDAAARPHAGHRLAGRGGCRRRDAADGAAQPRSSSRPSTPRSSCRTGSRAGRRTTRCGGLGAVSPWTGPSGPRSGTSSRPTGPRRASPGPSTSLKRQPSPRSTCGGPPTVAASTSLIMCWWTRGRTSARRTGSSCGR